MQLEEVEKLLNDIQNSTFQNKILNVIMSIYKDINVLREMGMGLQNKLNEIIIEVNEQREIQDELKERLDKQEEDDGIDIVE